MNNASFRFTPFHGVLLASLYISQGLPSGFLAHALPVLMREHQVPVEYIGFLKLLALPWFFKFMWAPAIDRYPLKQLGAHRGWILLLQTGVMALLLALSLIPHDYLFGKGLPLFLVLLFLVNLMAATQDVATDGLAVRILPARLRGLGNSLQVGGYKLGMIMSGNILLIALATLGWTFTFQILVVVFFIATIPAFIFREPPVHIIKNTPLPSGYWKESYLAFIGRPGIMNWLIVLLTFKIADSLGSAMIKPLLVDSGFSMSEIAQISLSAMIAGIIAAFVAAGIYYRLGASAALVLTGCLQALGIGFYSLIPLGLTSPAAVYAIAIFEQMADGMSTVTLFAIMMSYCREGHEGGDYTLQVSMHMIIAGTLGMLSGFVVKAIGYDAHFILAGCAGLLALLPAMTLASKHSLK